MASRGDAGNVSTAALLARGYQPAVVKVVSYAHGATRATASAQYIERDEVELETHAGNLLADKAAVAEEIKAWSTSFEKRQPSQDVVTVRLQLSGLRDTAEDRERLSFAAGAAFEGHRHALRIEARASGEIEARAVVVMARTISPEEKALNRAARTNGEKSSTLPPRLRVVDQRMGTTEDAPMRKAFDARSEAAMKARIETATGYPQHGISIEPATPGHGRDALGQRLSTLISKAPALDHLQRPIRTAEDIRDVTRDWGRHLRSQSPRDTMHMVVSAKAGTDEKVFTNAVRSFLHQQFADHKFMFGVHTDKAEAGHIHAHAIVAVRSESGTKLHPGPTDLAQWRVNYASHAREHGLKVVATRAAEQASSRSYGPKDKSIVDVATNPRPKRKEQDRAYASDPRNANLIRNAQERMAIARANPIRIPMTGRERAGVSENLEHWQGLAKADPAHEVARAMVDRLSVAKEAGDAINALRAVLSPEQVAPSHPSPNNSVRAPEMTENAEKSADAMLRDLRLMNQRIAEVTNLLPEGSRQRFTQQATGYLEKIAERIDQQQAQEAKANVPAGVQAAARSPVSDQAQPAPEHGVPIDPLAELRRQQTEMLERLAQARGQSRDHERGHEAGD
ncbi:relaxase/mobilization nuclease domain-containing protein [Rhabdaerophilum sp. SD176]|uniref:relaxase/mobilization nuclease domain-containing protein n=1 Tax=Rhabdaerophilum sp. SD176 TaxID=2983548 RepID=UPI0024DF30E2|nr:relaxase/mobilization nuclease domain-containing protein [Rhabdaerophilum sp. SD176]